RGYKDNRWLTFKQMEDKGWTFKRDEEGRNLGKNAGVPIEYFELRDKETKKPFNSHILDGMTSEEKQEYVDNNVFPLRKYYRVFNAEVIDGIPQKEVKAIDVSGINDRAERLLKFWSENESEIVYGGDEAYYNRITDKVHLPKREQFNNMQEFYSTSFHEVGHSTGHANRLNRDLSGDKHSESYAIEELRAEIASMFMEQDLEIQVSDKHVENNSAYIKSWYEQIKNDPNVLFKAIADAERITKYITDKEKLLEEPYAIVEDVNEKGEKVYRVRMSSGYGQTRAVLSGQDFASKDELLAEFSKMQELPFWKDKHFKEVSLDELEAISRMKAEQEAKTERLRQVEEDKSEIFVLPSQIASKAITTAAVVDMTNKGIESLTKMDDRDVIDRASKSKYGDKFLSLFNGESVLGDTEKDERSLITRLAVFSKDKEQLLRIFKASGQYREDKPNSVYLSLITDAINTVTNTVSKDAQANTAKQQDKKRFNGNFKR
ncbi:MAG: zincin-like metallopeptidase domain-containing protein, partial [Lachnospiraceae bacterium]|nr:zincin-like metallopeptidase domain-containing protein [Lachnospiraceae bacterium]